MKWEQEMQRLNIITACKLRIISREEALDRILFIRKQSPQP